MSIVHYRHPNPQTLLRPEPGIELSHALFRAIFAAKPNRTTTNEIADHNSVAMPFPDGDLINADCLWAGRAGMLELGFHISPRWRMTWNLSNKIAACGACAAVDSRNGFHMSITARRMRELLRAPSQA